MNNVDIVFVSAFGVRTVLIGFHCAHLIRQSEENLVFIPKIEEVTNISIG